MNASVSLFNFGFCLNYNFIVKQLINYYRHTTYTYAFHIDSTTLADGTYELVPEAKEVPGEAQVNFADAVEDPNPTSEASKTNLAQEGKPRCIHPSILNVIPIYVPIMYLCI